MKEIPLTQGKVALVDDEDYPSLSKHKWQARFHHNNWYAQRTEGNGVTKKSLKMHRFVLGLTPRDGLLTDHKDRNGLNNCRSNLRIATHQQNILNRKRQKNNLSGYRGVYWAVRKKKWGSAIGFFGKNITIGYFKSIEDAAKAYDSKAKILFGEWAITNF